MTIDQKGQAHIDFQDAAALRALTACLLKEDWGYDVDLSEDDGKSPLCRTCGAGPRESDIGTAGQGTIEF